MTHEEAIKEIKRLFCFGNDTECAFYLNKLGKCNNCALNTAKEALEKQIPKKPIERIEGWLYWECPSCGAEVGENMVYKVQRCACGQALDWSE